VRIITPSRLHFGFIDPVGKSGRIYGSMGVALKYPAWDLRFSRADRFVVDHRDDEVRRKVLEVADRVKEIYDVDVNLRVEIASMIPLHKGFGAGTQLSLAIGEGMLRILGLPCEREDIVKVSGRGKRSGVGIASYFDGGFNLDVGRKRDGEGLPLSVFHFGFPRDWVFLVVLPSLDLNIHGGVEDSKIVQVDGMGVEEICTLVLMKLIPSLIERDIALFGESVTLIQRLVGRMFSKPQGGVFAHPVCEMLIDFMLQSGAFGAGQSSWGPVVYGLVKRQDALGLKRRVEEHLRAEDIAGDVWVVEVDNYGRKLVGE